MKITFCTYDWPNYVGGPNVWLKRLLPELRDKGVNCSVLFFTYHAHPDRCPTVMELRNQGFDCPAIRTPVYMEDRVRWLLRKIRENPPDVFVPNLMIPAFFASRWVKQAGIPAVGVLHSDDPQYHAIQKEFMNGDTAYRADAIVCVSRYLEIQARKNNSSEILIKRIPYGIPYPKRIAEPPKKRRMRLVYVGRLREEQKRISELTHALCRAVREVPNTEAIIYGKGPDAYSVRQILATKGHGLPVTLAGRVDSEQIQEQLLDSHVLVLLSDYEGLPISLMEAMACGVVPVCLKIRSGIPELVEHEKTGLLVEDRGDDFIGAIRRLRDDPDLWLHLSRAARARIETEYSREESAARWEAMFYELLENAGERRKIQIPRRIILPSPHPDLAQGDVRKPAFHELYLGGAWRLTGRMFRQVLNKAKEISR